MVGPQDAHLEDLVLGLGAEQADLRLGADDAVHEADVDDDAAVGVVDRVEEERAERRVGVALGSRPSS